MTTHEREAFEGWARRYLLHNDNAAWKAWQAAAARYEGVVEAARNHRNATKAFHDSAQAKDTHAQVLAAQLIEQYEGDLYQALAALDGAHE